MRNEKRESYKVRKRGERDETGKREGEMREGWLEIKEMKGSGEGRDRRMRARGGGE